MTSPIAAILHHLYTAQMEYTVDKECSDYSLAKQVHTFFRGQNLLDKRTILAHKLKPRHMLVPLGAPADTCPIV